jgi:hypothetical protein
VDGKAVERIFERLRGRKEPSPLVPDRVRDAALDREIEALVAAGADTAERALQSALHLWNDRLERAHELAQEIHDPTGSYLHGVMHRREPDYENSRYWFDRVGRHPLFPRVREAAIEALEGRPDLRRAVETGPDWDPYRMIDWCRDAAADPGLEAVLRAVQAREIELLAHFCRERVK